MCQRGLIRRPILLSSTVSCLLSLGFGSERFGLCNVILGRLQGSGGPTSVILFSKATPPVAAIGTSQLGSGGGIKSVRPLAMAKTTIGAVRAERGMKGKITLNT